MNLGGIRSLTQLYLGDLDTRTYDPDIIDTFINEGLRVMAYETLLLEEKDSSLTYVSASDGFTLPTDFIKVKDLIWVDSNSGKHSISQVSHEQIYKMRNDWLNLAESAGNYLQPLGYAIHDGVIVLDSVTQTSPTLYYYKYDTALSADTSTPSFDSEYHSMLADYAVFKLTKNFDAMRLWKSDLAKMSASKMKQAKTSRVRYVGL